MVYKLHQVAINFKEEISMDKEQIEIIIKGGIDLNILTDEEKEIALIMLKDLEGTLVIRATSILNFCLKAIQYNKVKN